MTSGFKSSRFVHRESRRPSLSSSSRFSIPAGLLLALIIPLAARATSNPVPFISEVSPTAVAPGGGDFTLTVRGTGFINGQSAIYWNGAALPDSTTCTAANPPQLASCSVIVRATMIATAATASIAVVSAGPGGGASNLALLPITNATSNVTMSRTALISSPQDSVAAVVGDFNGDGKLDLAIADPCPDTPSCSHITTPGAVSILLANGDGTFTPTAMPPATGVNPRQLAVGDFNGDGKLDLLAVNFCGNDVTCNTAGETISVLLGDGTGNFTAGTTLSLPNRGTTPLMLGDFNGDGKSDFAIIDYSNANPLAIFLGNGDGTFALKGIPAIGGVYPQSLVSGDFNGDGNLDFVLQECLGSTATCHTWGFAILLGDGTGNFTPAASYPNPTTALGQTSLALMTVGDFNGDRTPDLAVCDFARVTIFQGNGDGSFTALPSTSISGSSGFELVTGDFNGDGKLDLAVSDGANNSILLGDGKGSFSAVFPLPYGSSLTMIAGDFNGDGRLDLLDTAGDSANSAILYLQAPDLTVSSSHTGSFAQGQAGATYAISVTDSGSVPTSGLVTATDTLPTGLTATAMSGSGWDCSANSFPFAGNGMANLSCTHSDALAPGASYPPITLTVNVAVNALASLTNMATVSGGGDSDTSNNTVSDATTIVTYNVSVSPSLTFFPQLVGTTSVAVEDKLTAGGNATVQITGIGISGDFAQTNDCGSSVAAGTFCTINITFTPTATGTRTGTITITDNAPDSPQTISLTGVGTQPAVTLSATNLSFGGQLVGNVGLPQNFTLTNSGTSPLNISSVAASSSFGDYNGCVTPLPAGSTCTIGVAFDPATSGSISGTLTITDDAPGSPHTVALSGTGQDFTLAPSSTLSTTQNIAPGMIASYSLALAPAGGFNQTVAFTCSGAPAKATCAVSPSLVTLNPISPTTITVNVATAASTASAPQTVPWPGAPGAPPLLVWPCAVLLAGAMLAYLRRARGLIPRRTVMVTAVLTFALSILFSMPGCGGTAMQQAPAVRNSGTPSGTYTVVVTGTYSTGADTLSHSVPLTLTVR